MTMVYDSFYVLLIQFEKKKSLESFASIAIKDIGL